MEFGAKVNNIQVDGISFIEHHSFEAFNEGVRLKQCIEYQESLTGAKLSVSVPIPYIPTMPTGQCVRKKA